MIPCAHLDWSRWGKAGGNYRQTAPLLTRPVGSKQPSSSQMQSPRCLPWYTHLLVGGLGFFFFTKLVWTYPENQGPKKNG